MQKRFILACALCALVLVFSEQAKSSLPSLKWKIESITSGVMHGAYADLPESCNTGQVYVVEDANPYAPDRTVGLCRSSRSWSMITPANYERLKVISKELAIPLGYAQITTAAFGDGYVVEYAWNDHVSQAQRVHTSVMVRYGGITRDWSANAAKRGYVDKSERAAIEQGAANVLGNTVQAVAR
jgi:hypothetical protein